MSLGCSREVKIMAPVMLPLFGQALATATRHRTWSYFLYLHPAYSFLCYPGHQLLLSVCRHVDVSCWGFSPAAQCLTCDVFSKRVLPYADFSAHNPNASARGGH
jgi:hypothetical protein